MLAPTFPKRTINNIASLVSDIVPCQVRGWSRVCRVRSFRVTPSDLSRSNLLGAVSVRSANRTVTVMCARNRVGQGGLDYMGTRSSISRSGFCMVAVQTYPTQMVYAVGGTCVPVLHAALAMRPARKRSRFTTSVLSYVVA